MNLDLATPTLSVGQDYAQATRSVTRQPRSEDIDCGGKGPR
jgi:hypothetical protein